MRFFSYYPKYYPIIQNIDPNKPFCAYFITFAVNTANI